jgi:FlaG/FlaF family flagellin (archaellin)
MRRLVFALLSCAIVIFVSACGGGNDSVDSLLSQTFAPDKAVKSGRLNVQLDADVQGVQGLNGPVRLRLNGPFQSTGKGQMPRFDFTLGLTAGGQTFSAGGVSTGDKGFVKFQGQAYSVSDQLFNQFKNGYLNAAKQSTNKKSNAPTLGALGIDPRRWLTGAKKAGEEKIGDTDTIHITAGIDVGHLLDDVNRLLGKASSASGSKSVPHSLTPQQRTQIQNAVDSASVDVFTGKDDKLLRRLDVNVKLKPSGKLKGGTVRFQLQLDALNKDQTITPPGNTKPLDQLLQQLGASAGSGSSGTGSTTPTPTPVPTTPAAPSTGSGSGSSNSKYLDCLSKAGSDLTAVQKCASLLG